MWVGSVRSTPCTFANEELDTLTENNPHTLGERRRTQEQYRLLDGWVMDVLMKKDIRGFVNHVNKSRIPRRCRRREPKH